MAKRKLKVPAGYAGQPAVAALLRLLKRARGTMIREAAKARGCATHTVRDIMSRLRATGMRITVARIDSRGGLVFRVLP